jgi:exodeoxyribonuclease V alpha subunit
MLYTAVTRGIHTVVLVGDINLINEVICTPPRSLERTTALEFVMEI